MAKVVSVNISHKKGVPKTNIGTARLKIDHGVEGDAHAGSGLRQVSLLSSEAIADFQNTPHLKVCLKNGIFGENITTEGIELESLEIGTRLAVGETILEVSKIGKDCLKPCFIMESVGDCIMPKKGIFAMVVKEGTVSVGDQIEII